MNQLMKTDAIKRIPPIVSIVSAGRSIFNPFYKSNLKKFKSDIAPFAKFIDAMIPPM